MLHIVVARTNMGEGEITFSTAVEGEERIYRVRLIDAQGREQVNRRYTNFKLAQERYGNLVMMGLGIAIVEVV